MLQNDVMVTFKKQCCHSHGVTEDSHEMPGQSAFNEKAKM